MTTSKQQIRKEPIMSQQAIIAIKAARMRKQVGRWASMKFAINNACPLSLYRLACQLEAAK